ncbi:succinylglutamate desuccinylase/aspartoacylase family protein [Francisella sp. 19X1-34]|uniref:succinylglutamate desuccinylase/aspartoacylase domain-containing protein n=1 Tax=Francisella sp. 19X1-34 TaxID=3087177 RepID=UPI002E305B4E|nr:succinylglutamate desuccinylase/aspartoacylase family protein [Francisella sp. 19X1-34]MED7789611.1 succinylglutamate desuccinylase/aspartoacylase family protein [Francisella sp. 19X1-34]
MSTEGDVINLFSSESYPKEKEIKNGNIIKYYNDGIVAIFPKAVKDSQPAIIVSAGVHGDEALPVGLVYNLFKDLLNNLTINRPLMIILGNLKAIELGERMVEVDLNRCFNVDEDTSNSSIEHKRAFDITVAIKQFKEDLDVHGISIEKHLDLHSYKFDGPFDECLDDGTQFAICVAEQPYNINHKKILDACNIRKIVIDIKNMEGTFTSFMVNKYPSITSITFELGISKKLSKNNPPSLENILSYLLAQISEKHNQNNKISSNKIDKYRFYDTVTKSSEACKLSTDISLKNFTKYNKGDIVAYDDGQVLYRIPSENHTVLFASPFSPLERPITFILEKV